MKLLHSDTVNYEFREEPFRHIYYPAGSLLSETNCTQLIETFPSSSLLDSYSTGADKTYYTRVLPLYGKNGLDVQAMNLLTEDWQQLASNLISHEQIDSLFRILKINKKDEFWFELRLTEYIHGGWMSRHTDRDDKIFSFILYLCPEWKSNWGGSLALYQSEHEKVPGEVIIPGAGNAVIIVRSKNSWHEVFPISAQALAPRRSLLLHAIKNFK